MLVCRTVDKFLYLCSKNLFPYCAASAEDIDYLPGSARHQRCQVHPPPLTQTSESNLLKYKHIQLGSLLEWLHFFIKCQKKSCTCVGFHVGIRVQRQSLRPTCRANHSYEVKHGEGKHGAFVLTGPDVGDTAAEERLHLYTFSRHPSHSDQYIIITQCWTLMVLAPWIRRHRRHLGDPVNSGQTYLCLYSQV